MVICLEQGADLHIAQLIPVPLTVSCFNKIQIGFTFLVLAHPDSSGQHTHPFNGPFSGTTRVSGTRKVKPIWVVPEKGTLNVRVVYIPECGSVCCAVHELVR